MILSNHKPIIKLESVYKRFKEKQTQVDALNNINIEIEEGDIFGIIGQSGAGKSTLVRCINYLDTPTSGRVIFDGQNLAELSTKKLLKVRQEIGMIFQQFNLLIQRTVIDNICFPLEIAGVAKKEARKRAAELLKIVGLTDKAKSYPAQLSGGQKQRIAIARALATNPKVLLCDEATSALDPLTTTSILALLKEINQTLGITVIVITHEMSVIETICSKVAILDKGSVAEYGSVEEIFIRPKSEEGKKLIFSGTKYLTQLESSKIYRIVFDGQSAFKPVIANLVSEFKIPVNILFADTNNIDGKAVGQMLIQIPDDEFTVLRIQNYLEQLSIKFEEVTANV